MTPQDHALFDAKIEAKVATLGGDIKLNTQGLQNLKDRFDDLAAKMASVPTDIATLKTKVEHLPGKGFVVTAALLSITGLSGLLVLLQKLGILH